MIDVEEVLSGRAGGRGVRSLLRSSSPRRALLSVLDPTAAARTCRLRRVKFKPGRKLSAYYELSGDDGTGSSRAVALTWTPPAGAEPPAVDAAITAMEAEARERGLVEPFSRLSAAVPGLGLHLQVTPLDPAFPQLVRLADPAHVAALLGAALPVGSQGAKVTTVRYRPGQRHVLRYDTVPELGSQRVIAKLHRPGAAPPSPVAAAVAALLADHGPRVGAAPPATDLSYDGAVFYRLVDGRPLTRYLTGGRSALASQLQLAGALLRHLHDDAAPLAVSLAERNHDTEITLTRRASEHIQALLPTIGSAVADVLSRASDLLEQLPAEPPGFSHGDYKTDHLLATRNRLTLIDFDSCARAEPAQDLGKFLADLRFGLLSRGRHAAEPAQDLFLEGYGADASPLRLARARLYEAVLLVKLSARRFRVDEPAWPARTAAMVETADRLLRSVPV